MSSETSFVAIEERTDGKRAEGPAELRRVPVAVTAGWHGIGSVLNRSVNQSVAYCLPSRGASLPLPGSEPSYRYHSMQESPDVPTFLRRRPSMELSNGFKDFVSDHEDTPWHLEILHEQRADGSFPLSNRFIRLTGISKRRISPLLKELGHLRQAKEVLATALAVALLRERAPEDEDTWKGAVAKAEKFLRANLDMDLDGLTIIIHEALKD